MIFSDFFNDRFVSLCYIYIVLIYYCPYFINYNQFKANLLDNLLVPEIVAFAYKQPDILQYDPYDPISIEPDIWKTCRHCRISGLTQIKFEIICYNYNK